MRVPGRAATVPVFRCGLAALLLSSLAAFDAALAQSSSPAAAAADTARGAAARRRDSLAASPRRAKSVGRARLAHAAHATQSALATGARFVFVADSESDDWSRRADPASAFFRRMAPAAFWVPVAAVVAEPLVWADQTEDRHRTNAAYARSATTALALGFVVSRTTKFLVHRARPCTGEGPDAVSVRAASGGEPACPRGSHVSGESSFFSEHAMASFAVASAASFEAQRRNAPNVALVTGAGFSAATLLAASRVYQHHHWLSDVVVGAAVGTASGFLGAQLTPVRRLRPASGPR